MHEKTFLLEIGRLINLADMAKTFKKFFVRSVEGVVRSARLSFRRMI